MLGARDSECADGHAGAYEVTELSQDANLPRRRRWLIAAVLVVLVGGGVGLGVSISGGSAPAAPLSSEGVPLQQVPDLASADTTMSGAPVDGITCHNSFQQAIKYHIHVHVTSFVNGHQERIPAGAGIQAPRLVEHLANGSFVDNRFNGCLYALHVHTNDGIIHVESPTKGAFTLGHLFDIWQQPLSSEQVGPAMGTVVAFENGQRFTGSPRDIPLDRGADIQLDVGTPVVPFEPLRFNVIGLCGSGTQGCSSSPK